MPDRRCLETGIYPSLWKKADIIPVHEKEKKTENKKRKSQSKILQDGHGTVKKAKCRTSKGKVATATKKDGKLALQKNQK